MILWLKLFGVGFLSLLVAIVATRLTRGATVQWMQNQSGTAVNVVVGVAVLGNLAVFFLAFRFLTGAIVGAFAPRYWLIPGGILAFIVAVIAWWLRYGSIRLP